MVYWTRILGPWPTRGRQRPRFWPVWPIFASFADLPSEGPFPIYITFASLKKSACRFEDSRVESARAWASTICSAGTSAGH